MSRLIRFALFALAALAAACGGGQAQAPPGGEGGPAAFPPTEVKTIALEARPIPQTSEFVATIQSLRSTTVQPQVEGLVRQIFVQAGDVVRAGQPILQIDADRQQAIVGTLESQRAAREADLAFAKQQLTRMQQLHAGGAVSRSDLDQAESVDKNAEAQLAALQSQIRESQVELQYYRLTAPRAGVIGDIPIKQGDRITPSTVVTTIDEPEGLEAYINVPLERAMDLKPGLNVDLIGSSGDVIASNPITFIAPRADDATQSVLVKATLRRMPSGLRVKQYVRARIVWSNEPGLTVPVVAVNRVAGQFFAFVAEPAAQGFVARQKPVTLGNVVGEDYVVRGGLKAGDRVIVSNVQKIGDGAPVKPT